MGFLDQTGLTHLWQKIKEKIESNVPGIGSVLNSGNEVTSNTSIKYITEKSEVEFGRKGVSAESKESSDHEDTFYAILNASMGVSALTLRQTSSTSGTKDNFSVMMSSFGPQVSMTPNVKSAFLSTLGLSGALSADNVKLVSPPSVPGIGTSYTGPVYISANLSTGVVKFHNTMDNLGLAYAVEVPVDNAKKINGKNLNMTVSGKTLNITYN